MIMDLNRHYYRGLWAVGAEVERLYPRNTLAWLALRPYTAIILLLYVQRFHRLCRRRQGIPLIRLRAAYSYLASPLVYPL